MSTTCGLCLACGVSHLLGHLDRSAYEIRAQPAPPVGLVGGHHLDVEKRAVVVVRIGQAQVGEQRRTGATIHLLMEYINR